MNDHEQYADEEREYPTAAEEKADEIALDMADEERWAAEAVKASPEGDDWEDEEEDNEEWRPGECDHCFGQTVTGPIGDIDCACALGQGAAPEDCVCGPKDGDEE